MRLKLLPAVMVVEATGAVTKKDACATDAPVRSRAAVKSCMASETGCVGA